MHVHSPKNQQQLQALSQEQKMEAINGKSKAEMFQAHTFILNHTLSIAAPMSLKCAVELGIAEILHKHGKPLSLQELATAASVTPGKEIMLRRVMRVLVRQNIFAVQKNGDSDEDEDKISESSTTVYMLTPYSKLLLKDGANMSAYVLALLDQVLVKAWFFMSEWLQTKDSSSPFKLAHGGNCFWDVANRQPWINDLFNEAMAADSKCVINTVIAECPQVFKGLHSLVDVGGGTGTTATLIMKAFPEVKCTVFDLPHVVATLPKNKSFDAVGGDMFECVPPANSILLKSILHDWGDAECVKILKRCKSAIPSKEKGGSKIIIVEMIMNSNHDKSKVTETHLYFDVSMMTGVEGKEREEHEWRKIFTDAGFKNYTVYPMLSAYSVIELYP